MNSTRTTEAGFTGGPQEDATDIEEEGYYADLLLPGFIEANSGIQFGEPCLIGTRIPFSVGLGWVWETLDDKHCRRLEGLTREKIIALAAFCAGYEWHRSRKRRAKMKEEVSKLWERVAARGAIPWRGVVP